MRKALFYIWLALSVYSSHGQSSLFFSHYMFNPASYNPAWVGMDDTGSVSFLYRNQWTGYTTSFDGAGGAPNTQMLSFIVPVKGAPITGLGLNVSNDNLGVENNLQIQMTATYQLRLRFSTLQFGIMPGVFTKTLNGNNFRPNDPADERIPNSKETQTRTNLGLGVYFQSDQGYFFGVSVLNTLEPAFDFGVAQLSYSQQRAYHFHGGTLFKINEKFTLKPSAIIRTNFNSLTFDLGSILTYQDKLWTGLSYRLEESLIIYLGYSFLGDKLKAGYAFDYVVHNQDAKNPTSNEIYLRYNLPDLILGGKKSVKTPRFTF